MEKTGPPLPPDPGTIQSVMDLHADRWTRQVAADCWLPMAEGVSFDFSVLFSSFHSSSTMLS